MNVENLLVGLGVVIVVLLLLNLFKKLRAADASQNLTIPEPLQPAPTPIVESRVLEPVPRRDPALVEAELRQQLRSCSSAKDCWDIYEKAEGASPFEAEARRKFFALVQQQLSVATSFDEAWAVYELNPNDGKEDTLALERTTFERLLLLATTTEDVLSIYDDYLTGDENDIDDRTERVFRRALELAQTADEAESVFDEVERDSDLELLAVKKMLELTTDVESCAKVWNDHGTDSEYGELAILRAAEIVRSRSAMSLA